MKAINAIVEWTPDNGIWTNHTETAGQVRVVPKIHTDSKRFAMWEDVIPTYAICSKWQQVAMVFVHFHTIVTRDGIDPRIAHKAFLEIEEYRERMSPDIRGAVEEGYNDAPKCLIVE